MRELSRIQSLSDTIFQVYGLPDLIVPSGRSLWAYLLTSRGPGSFPYWPNDWGNWGRRYCQDGIFMHFLQHVWAGDLSRIQKLLRRIQKLLRPKKGAGGGLWRANVTESKTLAGRNEATMHGNAWQCMARWNCIACYRMTALYKAPLCFHVSKGAQGLHHLLHSMAPRMSPYKLCMNFVKCALSTVQKPGRDSWSHAGSSGWFTTAALRGTARGPELWHGQHGQLFRSILP